MPHVLPFAVAVFGAYTVAYCVYQVVSLPVNFAGRSFDLAAHKSLVSAWRPRHYPSVDIFLPICGEPIEVLRNTWTGVFELVQAYPGNAYVYVLDDGPSERGQGAGPVVRVHLRAPPGHPASTRRQATSTTPSGARAASTS